MDALSELSQATLEILARDWLLWSGLFALLLTFALYLYIFPRPFDFFANPDKRLRSEPPENQPQ